MPNGSACSTWQLYAILDRQAAGPRDLVALAEAAIRGGADALQLRDKRASAAELAALARRLLAVTRPAGIPLIINDFPEVAAAVGAQGVHLGQDDLPLPDARRLVGPGCLIGQSTHSLAQALSAQTAGADYIGVGPIFPTPTKPDYGSVGLSLVTEVSSRVALPQVCIGGIDAGNAGQVRAAGARCIAVVRAVCAAADPEAAARALKALMRDTAQPRSCV